MDGVDSSTLYASTFSPYSSILLELRPVLGAILLLVPWVKFPEATTRHPRNQYFLGQQNLGTYRLAPVIYDTFGTTGLAARAG